jgi:hypothetical protein
MQQYFFNFRKGDELSLDRVGMYLPDLDAARTEALYAGRELVELAMTSREALTDCAIEIAQDNGDTVLSIPLGKRTRLHQTIRTCH